jgi:TolB-like protein/DNA-binding winged helix-turn-helix (wHTH) protein/Tfp pilus assembly protein PilF
VDASAKLQLAFDDYVLDPVGVLRSAAGSIPLRPKTFEVLRFLASHAGQVATKEELFATLWPNVVVTDDSLVQCVREIRQALNDDDHRIVRTVPGRGYVFTRPVREFHGYMEAAAPAKRSSFRGWMLAIPVLILAAVLAPGLTRLLFPPRIASPVSIVVLPLANLSGDLEQEYFAEVLTDDLTTELSRIPKTFVIARNTAYTFKGKAIEARRLGSDLGVRYIFDGSVRRIGDRVRLNLRLVDAQTEQQLWSEVFEDPARELEALQRRVMDSIVRTLQIELYAAEAARGRRDRPRNPDAHDLAMRGWSLWNRQRPETVAEARELLLRAVAIDPQSAFAWRTLANTYLADILNRWIHLRPGHTREEWIALQEEATERAFALDPVYLPCAALMLRGKLEQSLACREKLMALNPSEPLHYHMAALAKIHLGQPRGALELERQAFRVSPRDTRLHNFHGTLAAAEYMLGNYKEAISQAQKAVDLRPDYSQGYSRLAAAAAQMGDMEKARAALAEFRRLQPDYTVSTFRKESQSGHADFLAYRERFLEGLRLAGLPD